MFNGVDGAPRIVTVIPLCSDVTAKELVMSIVGSLGPDVETKSCPELGIWRTRYVYMRTYIDSIDSESSLGPNVFGLIFNSSSCLMVPFTRRWTPERSRITWF